MTLNLSFTCQRQRTCQTETFLRFYSTERRGAPLANPQRCFFDDCEEERRCYKVSVAEVSPNVKMSDSQSYERNVRHFLALWY